MFWGKRDARVGRLQCGHAEGCNAAQKHGGTHKHTHTDRRIHIQILAHPAAQGCRNAHYWMRMCPKGRREKKKEGRKEGRREGERGRKEGRKEGMGGTNLYTKKELHVKSSSMFGTGRPGGECAHGR